MTSPFSSAHFLSMNSDYFYYSSFFFRLLAVRCLFLYISFLFVCARPASFNTIFFHLSLLFPPTCIMVVYIDMKTRSGKHYETA